MNVLPGKKVEVPMNPPFGQFGMAPAPMTRAAGTPSRVVGAGYQQQLADPLGNPLGDRPGLQDAKQHTLSTTTITLPRSLKARLHEHRVQRRGGASTHAEAFIQQTPFGTNSMHQPGSRNALAANQAAFNQAAVNLASSRAPAVTQEGLRSALPSAHFGQPQYQARALPTGPQGPAIELNPPNPSARRSALPWSHRRSSSPSVPVTWSNAGRTRG